MKRKKNKRLSFSREFLWADPECRKVISTCCTVFNMYDVMERRNGDVHRAQGKEVRWREEEKKKKKVNTDAKKRASGEKKRPSWTERGVVSNAAFLSPS